MASKPQNLETLIVEVDLAIVVRRACGCFSKYYFELDGTLPVDSDIECCPAHRKAEFNQVAAGAARKEADRIREKMR